ncbi:glycosyl hydrolase family 65 protein [Actinosynnema sp. NPDC047251]|uniref:Putative glycosyl hydrolase n=1 Tax=Saccharothrix espanaensis (strain ATCC 51144 / DSM 44229 / JCM 9112 / NBRC 15066 / NRRL 15764) TaxID=1179773 RepID=K0K050_SACES|nr:glycosyl hydrolase family 65 protein [Saccharothrix espanaensis]CCH29933.1 putative glycosyl hydrolase [Saccharothrix espanaensis DSM 44229]
MTGYDIGPWSLRWRGLSVPDLRRTESTFALSNGHIGMRGTLDEGEPRGLPGTYLNGFYEEHALPYGEAGYGYPEAGQTVVNVTDGKVIRLLVEDEPLDMRYGRALEHERELDFRTGTLRRRTVWESPTGRKVTVTSERLVSFTQRAVAAIHYVVEPEDDLQLVLQSDLLANEPIEERSGDPRVAAALDAPLVAEFRWAEGKRAVLAHRTRHSGLRLAAGMDHELEAGNGLRSHIHAEDDLVRFTAAADVPAGNALRLTKYLGYGWSTQRSVPALRAQVEAALAGARQTGWQGLLAEQKAFLDDFWEVADIEVDGDEELQQAMRFALFHILQAGARGETRAIPGKGLTGPGYDGHAFWDSEMFVLPVLTYTVPDAARDALRWRHSTVDKARDRAQVLGQHGAAFPWRSINGAECSAYWPAGTAAFHVSGGIAHAVAQYHAATGDEEFDRECGTELLVETARLWMSLGHHDKHGGFRIDGVTGPDEYSAIVDNNVYTNLIAQKNLREAAEACERNPATASALEVHPDERTAWLEAAMRMRVPFDALLGVHQQAEGFTAHAEWDFAGTDPGQYPLLLSKPYFDLYRKQVIKQADLVLAMHVRGDAFTAAEKAANFAYYEARTVRDSSLSAGTQSVLAAEVGALQLAYDYLAEAAFTDLHDLHDNVHNGLHMASLAGAWIGVVAGFGGMRDHSGLTFAPRLPPGLDRLAFRMSFQGIRFSVAITRGEATYRIVAGGPLRTAHHGEPVVVEPGAPVTLPIPEPPTPPEVHQPAHREPARRVPG